MQTVGTELLVERSFAMTMTVIILMFAVALALIIGANVWHQRHRSRLLKRQKDHEDRVEEREATIW